MTKTKKQLRAEAVERLKNASRLLTRFYSDGVTVYWHSGYQPDRESVGQAMLKDIELLTEDDSTTQEVDSTTEPLSDETDSREKLEADVLKHYTHTVSTAMWPPSANKHTDMVSVSMDTVLEWLDRQAAITANETSHGNPYVGLVRGKQWEHTEASDYYCGRCGRKVTDHDSYCSECGGALHKASNKPDSKFDARKTAETPETDAAKGDIRDFDDTREKLEEDVKEICWGKNDNRYFAQKRYLSSYGVEVDEGNVMANHEGHVLMTVIMHLLDRQDAITEEKTRYKWVTASAEEIDRWKVKAEKARDDAETWRKACGDVLDAADEIHRIMAYHFPNGR